MKNISPKVVFTGGHHNSTLTVAIEMKKLGYDIYWIGHKYSMWGDKNPSAEYKEVTASGLPFFELKAGKFYKTYHPLKLLRIPRGFIEAYRILNQVKPSLIITFGGYLAVPVALIGWILRIPVITHEQTAATGLSNWLIGMFAKSILLTYESSGKYFPKHKTIVIGLPLSSEFLQKNKHRKPPTQNHQPQIYITCGKQGAHQINLNLLPIIPELTKKYKIIHQTGSSTVYGDFQKALEVKQKLDQTRKNHYEVYDYLTGDLNWQAWFSSNLIIARSGAHNVYQLGLSKIPSILIPIPWAVNNEQMKNARILKNAGLCEILEEKDLSPDSLLEKVNEMMDNLDSYVASNTQTSSNFPENAKEKMVDYIQKILPLNR